MNCVSILERVPSGSGDYHTLLTSSLISLPSSVIGRKADSELLTKIMAMAGGVGLFALIGIGAYLW
jgi:hypothetical protein